MSVSEKNKLYTSLRRWLPRSIAYKLTVYITK